MTVSTFTKGSLMLVAMGLGATLWAQPIVVFGKGDSVVLGPGVTAIEGRDPGQRAFIDAVKADRARLTRWETSLALSDLPQGGRKAPGASGAIQFRPLFRGGFLVHVALTGLTPDHQYLLTLNGRPERAGNERLVEPVPGKPRERYYDFATVTTGADGCYEAVFAVWLPAGPYDVRFYVKDTTDYKIVLHHDFFLFTVE